MTRRSLLGLVAGSASALRAQRGGMASRGVKPTPRGKPSGIPWSSRLTDVARKAGLTAPIVYGFPDRVDYIIETMGAGAAFFDYDNDGWLDILVLSGTVLGKGPGGATNRLHRNNRDGTVTNVTEKAGLKKTGWATRQIIQSNGVRDRATMPPANADSHHMFAKMPVLRTRLRCFTGPGRARRRTKNCCRASCRSHAGCD